MVEAIQTENDDGARDMCALLCVVGKNHMKCPFCAREFVLAHHFGRHTPKCPERPAINALLRQVLPCERDAERIVPAHEYHEIARDRGLPSSRLLQDTYGGDWVGVAKHFGLHAEGKSRTCTRYRVGDGSLGDEVADLLERVSSDDRLPPRGLICRKTWREVRAWCVRRHRWAPVARRSVWDVMA